MRLIQLAAASVRWRRLARLRLLTPIALLIALAVCALPSAARATTVSGHVTDQSTGLPLDGIPLTFWYWGLPGIGQTIGTTTTVADGSYSWTGECPVQDSRVCYITISDERFLYAISQFRYDQAEVTADFVLTRPATVSGEVRIDGTVTSAAVDVNISYYSEEDEMWLPPPNTNSIVQTQDGRYRFINLPPGVPYRICAGGVEGTSAVAVKQCFDHHDQTRLDQDPSYDSVTLAAGEQRDDIDFDLVSGGGIEGTLHDGYLGGPLANEQMLVVFYNQNGARLSLSTTVSDADGRYRVKGLPDGAYYVRVSISDPFVDAIQIYPGIVCENSVCPPITSGGRLTVAGGATITGVDFTLHPISVVRGRVTDAATGLGLGGVQVFPSRWGSQRKTLDNGDFALYMPADVDPFEVYLVAPLPYVNQVYPAIACLEYPCLEPGQTFSPTTGEVIEHVDFALQTGAAIRGTLSDAVTGEPQVAEIKLYDQNFNLVWRGFAFDQYTTPAWLPGTYYVQAIARDGAFQQVDCVFYLSRSCPPEGGDPASVEPTPLVIAAGEVRDGVDFRLKMDGVFRDGFEPALRKQ